MSKEEPTNATYYESRVTCPKCKADMRPHAGECKCDSKFDSRKETFCGNCGKNIRKRLKLLNI